MKVKVTYKSGEVRNFIVPNDMLHHKFVEMAVEQGGPIEKIEFPE